MGVTCEQPVNNWKLFPIAARKSGLSSRSYLEIQNGHRLRAKAASARRAAREVCPEGLSPRGTTPRWRFCAQTLRAAGFTGGERRCCRGASLSKDGYLGSALLSAKKPVALLIFNFEIASKSLTCI